MNGLKSLIALFLAILGWYIFFNEQKAPDQASSPSSQPMQLEQRKLDPTPTPSIEYLKPTPPQVHSPSHEPLAPPAGAISFRLIQGWVVSQGDVLVGRPNDSQNFPESGFIEAPPLRLWENGTIPYGIDPDLRNPERILRAIEYMNTHTNVRFTPHNGEADAIIFVPFADHCLSYLGRVGGAQPVLLDDRCQDQEILHELMHVLGFVHEHSRPDRDGYVTVNWANIEEDKKEQFLSLPAELSRAMKGRPFDFQSLMIYSDRAFARDRTQPTLISKTGERIDPPRTGLSKEDKERINALYQ